MESTESDDSKMQRREGPLIIHGRAYDSVTGSLQPPPPTVSASSSHATRSVPGSLRRRGTCTTTLDQEGLLRKSGGIMSSLLQLHQLLQQQVASEAGFTPALPTVTSPSPTLQLWMMITLPWPTLGLTSLIPIPRSTDESDSDEFGRGLQGVEEGEEVLLSVETWVIHLSQEEPE